MPAFGLVDPALPDFGACHVTRVCTDICTFHVVSPNSRIQYHHHLSGYFGPFPVPDENLASGLGPFPFSTTLMPLLSESVHRLLTFSVFPSSFVFGAMILGSFIAPTRHFWSYALNDVPITTKIADAFGPAALLYRSVRVAQLRWLVMYLSAKYFAERAFGRQSTSSLL